ncbi:MAG: dicarboxylate/amino acid:cation symporter [Piscirickettsiaceae bacterium CG_4_9_14_3_um_filter_43_564]|nr:dicarboxylate/amino acid:cation symporter [Thiomicrospira sp.]OIP95232.1 MAG: dicarboxylate/amino acid:cation symporter [Thiomicrospira sp. CG2_30_44_34]PIQ03918.1 MAG: dicarboxylate/amino acid:cation symporter [Piscirickettsiaceae bacterium CG18_big_fil_WC_8_21_14_2_50_44_103]PIU38472.1 MAG: dicarboxylate/amino acid:cation symporter [Piscirickettsiaceae bacterium CG07_land_8_20_14_0_80_44_28]PIW57888.1 MAG: dicarboxylate/amino acid:cation symporter [Piscirickettsiaceae bacterium CG12_big_fi
MKLALHWQILIALFLAIFMGIWTGTDAMLFGVSWLAIYSFMGTLFLNALKMIVVPLVVSAIITGVANVGDQGGFGRLGAKTISYYVATSFIAIMIGLILVNVIQPGVSENQTVPVLVADEAVMSSVAGKSAGDVVDIFLRMIPVNVVDAAAQGQMLGLIFFSLLFGYFMTRLDGNTKATMNQFWQGIFEVMMLITGWVMKFAPIGVFGLVAASVAKTGLDQFENLAWFFLTVVLALAMHMLVVMPLLLRFVGKVTNPWLHFQAMAPALLTAFSTSSSSATLPITLNALENRAGVSNRVSSFVLPLGATVNMDGTALYECVAAVFIAQLFGVPLDFSTQLLIVVIALTTSIGVAGIPSASLVAISIILVAVGLPAEAIGLLLVVDRLLDMMRTMVNIFSDSVGAVIIARSEGEDQVLVSKNF